jgi:hypothetical protein
LRHNADKLQQKSAWQFWRYVRALGSNSIFSHAIIPWVSIFK